MKINDHSQLRTWCIRQKNPGVYGHTKIEKAVAIYMQISSAVWCCILSV